MRYHTTDDTKLYMTCSDKGMDNSCAREDRATPTATAVGFLPGPFAQRTSSVLSTVLATTCRGHRFLAPGRGAKVPVQDQLPHATIWAMSRTLSTTASPESLLLLPRFSTPPRQQRTADLPTASTLSGWVQATSASGSPDSACASVAEKASEGGTEEGRDAGVKVGS